MSGEIKPDAATTKKLREGKGWTQRDLADQAGVSVKTVSSMENGREIYLSTLKRVAGALGVDPKELIEEAAPASTVKKYPVKFGFSFPKEQYDESADLRALVDLLQRLFGGEVEGGPVEEKSTVVTVMMEAEAIRKLIERHPELKHTVNPGLLSRLFNMLFRPTDMFPVGTVLFHSDILKDLTEIELPVDCPLSEWSGKKLKL